MGASPNCGGEWWYVGAGCPLRTGERRRRHPACPACPDAGRDEGREWSRARCVSRGVCGRVTELRAKAKARDTPLGMTRCERARRRICGVNYCCGAGVSFTDGVGISVDD